MKKRLWILHSWIGLIAGLGLLLIGVTGSLLVFRDQLDGLFATKMMRVVPTPAGRLPLDELLASAQRAWPNFEVTGFGRRRDVHLADLVYLKQIGSHEYRAATLDPYTAKPLADPMNPNGTLTGLLLELHYTWFAEHIGMLITGIFAVLLCLLGVTGVWLYRDFWKNFFTLRWGRSARIFFSDAHKMLGISSVVFNLLLGFTGAYWNITHVATDGLGHHDEEADRMPGRLYSSAISLEKLSAEASSRLSGFEVNWVSFPTKPGEDITLWGKVPSSNPFTGDYGSTVVFDPQTGALKSANDLRQAGLWAKITDTFAPLHYGTFGGWPIKVLWCLGGLTPGLLATTGFLVWRARRRSANHILPSVP